MMKTISKVDFSPTALYVSPANNFRTEGQMQNARKPKKNGDILIYFFALPLAS